MDNNTTANDNNTRILAVLHVLTAEDLCWPSPVFFPLISESTDGISDSEAQVTEREAKMEHDPSSVPQSIFLTSGYVLQPEFTTGAET